MTDVDKSPSQQLNDGQSLEQPPENQPQSRAEWISLGFSSFVLAIVVGLVIYLWVSDHKRQPPVLQVTTATARKVAKHYYVPFTVTNSGGETAESVQVIAELRVEDTVLEAGEQTIDFLSSQEKAEGAFIFAQDPRQAQLMVRVASYSKP
jgi:uncharacterized protein (TIGR02588 family)